MEHEQAFNSLKSIMISQPVLALYDSYKEHQVHTDASSIGLSGIILKLEDGKIRAVFYYSR